MQSQFTLHFVGHRECRVDTGHMHAQSVGRGRKRQRVKSATTSPAAGPAAATTEPADTTTLRQGAVQAQLPPHLVRSPVGHAPDTPARFQWKAEDVAVLLNGIEKYGSTPLLSASCDHNRALRFDFQGTG